VGGGDKGDHLWFSFGYFLLVEVLKGVWSLDSNAGAVVEEGSEYLVSSFGDISLSMDGCTGLVGSGIKTDESSEVFVSFESVDVCYLRDESCRCNGTKAGDGLEEGLVLYFVLFELSVNIVHLFAKQCRYLLVYRCDGSVDDSFFVLYVCGFSLHISFHV